MQAFKQSKLALLPSSLWFSIELPPGYAAADVFFFHGRDEQALSEEVLDGRIRKAILLDGVPTVFEIEFDDDLSIARCNVLADGAITPKMKVQARDVATSLLGLRINPVDFAKFVTHDPIFGPLTRRQDGLRIAQSSSVFEALTWAIMGQQINVAFAVSLRRTFIRLAGVQHSSGLLCYPSPKDASQISIEELTSRQFSRTKAASMLALSALVASGEIDLCESPENPLSKICDALLAVKGIGAWTVNYALLRGYGYADCSLHGDVAVRSAIGRLWQYEVRPDIAQAETFLKAYAPHRTMAAAHLWASLSDQTNY